MRSGRRKKRRKEKAEERRKELTKIVRSKKAAMGKN